MEWLWAIGIATGISLQSWILLKLVNIEIKLSAYDQQLKRIVSDAESEKANRKTIHAEFGNRLLALERKR